MSVTLLFSVIFWGYILTVFRRTQLVAFYYIWGSIGIFFILITLSNPYWVWEMTRLVTHVVSAITEICDIGKGFIKYGGILIDSSKSSIFLTIDYECSGIIEISALISLLIFFPVYSRKEKLFYSFLGFIGITLSNIVRLLSVIFVVHIFGEKSFFIAHSILGRLIFYVLTIIIYYYIFTYSQIDTGIYQQTKNSLRKR